MSKSVNELSNEEVLDRGPWPSWFTIDQMRSQLRHDERGNPPPWKGAVWNGLYYTGGDPTAEAV